MDEPIPGLLRNTLQAVGRGKGLAVLAGVTGKDATNLSTAARRYYSGVTKTISPKYVDLIKAAGLASTGKTVTIRAELTLPRTEKERNAGTAQPRPIDVAGVPLQEAWEYGGDSFWFYFPDDAEEYVEATHGFTVV